MSTTTETLRAWPEQGADRSSVGGCLRGALATFSMSAANLFAAPGIGVLVGSRTVVARLLGRDIRQRDFFLTLGGRSYVSQYPHRWGAAAMALIPSVVLSLTGGALLWPTFVDLLVLGISPVPSATTNPALLTGGAVGSVGVELFAVSGAADAARIWVGAACWYCASPEFKALTTTRRELRTATRARPLAQLVRAILVPLIAIRAFAAVIDEAALWFGLNLFIGAGGTALLGLALLEASLVRVFY